MNIHSLMSTTEREMILGYLLEHPSEKINMNKLARKLALSTGQIHKYVTILRNAGLVNKDQLQESPLARALRLVWNLKRIEEADVVEILKRSFPNASGFGLYGSWASGSNYEDSDLDIWIKVKNEPKDLEMAKAKKELASAIGVSVDLTVATPKRLEHFREKSDAFYFSLYNAITLWGDGL